MEVLEKREEKFRFKESQRIGNVGTGNKEWGSSPGGEQKSRAEGGVHPTRERKA